MSRFAGYLGAAVTAAGLLAASAAAAGPSVEVKDAVARIVVIPESRSDIRIDVVTRNSALPLEVRTEGGRTIIDGGLHHGRIGSCYRMGGGPTTVRVRGVGAVRWDDIPQIVIRTPMSVDLGVGGAVFGSIARADSVEFANAGCGDWTLANVKGTLDVSVVGSGDIKAGSAGKASVSVAGSGDVALQGLAGGAVVSIAGSGDTHIANLQGPLSVQVAGSGDISVADGHATRIQVSIAGSGGVDFGGVAESVDAQIMGSGDVHVRQVTGAVSKSVMGSGEVTIGR